MACRKAAYRAMTEMSEWMEEQREKQEQLDEALYEEQRKIWTPFSLLENCCVKWLAHGPERGNSSRGCSGGCGKDHPRITLTFDNEQQQSVAVLSHDLDPFLAYFESLCRRGMATPNRTSANNNDNKKKKSQGDNNDDHDDHDKISSTTRYDLTGYLQTHLDRMMRKEDDQSILYKHSHLIKVSAEALAASKRAQERNQLEQEERDAKRRKLLQPPTMDADGDLLLYRVLEVCYNNHSLQDNLDLAEIAWMRLAGKTMAKFAAKLASSRLQQLRLSITAMEAIPDHPSQSEHWSLSCKDVLNGTFVSNSEFSLIEMFETLYLRVYFEGFDSPDGKEPPEKHCLGSQPLEVRRYELYPRHVRWGVECPPSIPDIEIEWRMTEWEGILGPLELKIKSLRFGFQDLLGIYVRKKLPLEKQKFQDIKQKRPVTRLEKQYVKALAKAAREAPGSSWDFRDLEGWGA